MDSVWSITVLSYIMYTNTVHMTPKYFETVKSTIFNQISHENETKLVATPEVYGARELKPPN
jgi:hypothetical protein